MRILPSLFLSLSFITSYVAAQDGTDAQKETYDYQVWSVTLFFSFSFLLSLDIQSDVARMRKIVINRYVSHPASADSFTEYFLVFIRTSRLNFSFGSILH